MTRAALVTATAKALGIVAGCSDIRGTATLMGVSRTLVWKIMGGQRRLTDDQAVNLANGLRDHARRCEALASLVDKEIRVAPLPRVAGRRGQHARGASGRFEVRA